MNKPTPFRWSRADWLNIIGFALLVMLFHWRILTPNLADQQSFPPGDFSHQFWAFTTFEARELSSGRLPLWNPYTFAGTPFWADVQSAVFYPPSLVTLLLSASSGFSLFALEVEAIAHFWLAAWFMYLFIRHITQNRQAAVISALTFTFSGYLTGYPSQQLAILESAVWLPLILYFIAQIKGIRNQKDGISNSYSQSTLRYVLFAGATFGLTLLAGHPQTGFIVATISLLYLGFTLYQARNLKRNIQCFILHASCFVLASLGLAAIQFIPAIEYTLLSVRAEGTYDKMAGGFPLIDLVQILLPGLVSHYSPLYIGFMGLILALTGIFTRQADQRQAIFWAAIAGISLLISFGGNTFFYSPFYLSIPGFSIFRGQERWALATTFSLSVLVGYGYLHVVKNNVQFAKKTTNYLLWLAMLLTGLSFYGLNDTGWAVDSPFYGLLEVSTLLTIGLLLVWVLWQGIDKLSLQWLTILTVGIICFDLFTVNWETNLYPQQPEWHTQLPTVVQAIHDDVAEQDDEHPFRVYHENRIYDRDYHYPNPFHNYGLPYQLEDLWGASPLRLARYDKFLAPPMPIERAWDLFNVKYVITWRETLYLPSTIIYQEPAPDGTTYLHRLDEVKPRAWFVYQTEIADEATILQKLADPAFDRWQIALLEPTPLTEKIIATLPNPLPTTSASIITYPSDATPPLTYHITSPTPALLILSEPYYPGWQATVNGEVVPIVQANYLLRAIPVPAGESTITLTFRPLSFTIGLVISGLTLLVIGIAIMTTRYSLSIPPTESAVRSQ